MIVEIGTRVRHKVTGITGKVIGYGQRQQTDSYCTTTLKVELRSCDPIRPIAEDTIGKWQVCRDKKILACTLPYFPKPTASKASVA